MNLVSVDVPKPVPPPEKTVTVTMTEEEVQRIAAVLGNTSELWGTKLDSVFTVLHQVCRTDLGGRKYSLAGPPKTFRFNLFY